MKKTLVAVTVVTLVAVAMSLGGPADATDGGEGEWRNPTPSPVCEANALSPDAVCVDWFQEGNERDGILCCVSGGKLSNNTFGDCEHEVGRRAPRVGDMHG